MLRRSDWVQEIISLFASMIDTLQREFIYIAYYFEIQLKQILFWYLFGVVLGSVISVFLKDRILEAMKGVGKYSDGFFPIVLSSLIGIVSPLCMYGTIPIAASLSRGGIKDSFLAAFMMSSILLNPQLIAYSFALGGIVVFIRLLSCFVCGVTAGLLVRLSKRQFFCFKNMDPRASRDIAPSLAVRLLKNIGRNLKATGVYFLIGILLSALFQRYVPSSFVVSLFGKNEGFGVLLAATIGVPLYACGGGTIPLLQAWLSDGMSLGSATAFMITGPSTKITNLGALKIVLKGRTFIFYILFVVLFSLLSGFLVDLFF